MLFPSNVFLFCFLPVILVLYYIVGGAEQSGKKRIWKNMVLFVGSIIFYAYGEKWYCLLLLISILWNWGMGLCINRTCHQPKKQKVYLVLMLAVNLGILFAYKYLDFVIANLNRFMKTQIQPAGLALPIGISFFTFQAISYCVDVYRKKADAQKNPFYVGLYIALFPQLIAGPIVRYESIALQIEKRKETLDGFTEGVERFLVGICKKVLLADIMAIFADRIFNQVTAGESIAVSMAWLGAIAYTLQIYYDFSGYSDMAIGLGKMFGFDFNENFNYPYTSLSIREFWRRWHISLSTWFREYVYIPLGGSRKGQLRTYINLGIVFLLTGIWHGASYNFVFWGIYHGAFLIVERIGLGKFLEKHKVLAGIYTFLAVVLGWVLFRIESMRQIWHFGKRILLPWMYGSSHYSIWEFIDGYTIFMLVCAVVGMGIIQRLMQKQIPVLVSKWRFSVLELMYCAMLLILCISALASNTYNPFIYFRF